MIDHIIKILQACKQKLVQVEVVVNDEIDIFVVIHCFSVKYPLDFSIKML